MATDDKHICPKCGKDTGREIIYGQPDRLEDDKAYGGCCIFVGQSPEFRCLDCRHEWGVIEGEEKPKSTRRIDNWTGRQNYT